MLEVERGVGTLRGVTKVERGGVALVFTERGMGVVTGRFCIGRERCGAQRG